MSDKKFSFKNLFKRNKKVEDNSTAANTQQADATKQNEELNIQKEVATSAPVEDKSSDSPVVFEPNVSEMQRERILNMYTKHEPVDTSTIEAAKEMFNALCRTLKPLEFIIKPLGNQTPYDHMESKFQLSNSALTIGTGIEKGLGVLNFQKIPELLQEADMDSLLITMKYLHKFSAIMYSRSIKPEFWPRKITAVLAMAYNEVDRRIGNDAQKENAVRVDILKKDYCRRLKDEEALYKFFEKIGNYEVTSMHVDKLTGRLIKIHEEVDAHMISHLSYSGTNAAAIRSLAAECSPELGQKFESFTEENWKDFVTDSSINEPSISELSKKEVSKTEKVSREPDFDAYYIVIHRHFGSDMVFLRKTDNGWRVFKRSPGFFPVEDCTEQAIAELMNRTYDCQMHTCIDRIVSADELAYAMHNMPEKHPDERPDGALRKLTPISMYQDDQTVACYLKNGKWIPCADFENILKISNDISTLASNRLIFVD